MQKISFFRRTDFNFPVVSGLIFCPTWTQENPALNVNFSILDAALGLVVGLVLGLVLGPILDPVLGPVLGRKLRPH